MPYEVGVHDDPVDVNDRLIRVGTKYQATPPGVADGDNVYLLVDAAGRLIVIQQYVPNVFKHIDSVAITAGTPATIWTPASGKTIRLLGYSLTASASASMEFQDSAAAGTVIFATGVAGIITPVVNPTMGAGLVLAAADNTLELDVTASVTISGTVFGIEE